MSIEKIYTDNIPLLDELVYYFKIICKDIVLKNEQEADRYETLESARNATRYIAAKEGNAGLELFEITEDILIKFNVPIKLRKEALANPKSLPNMYKNAILKYFVDDMLNNYNEMNNYYRRLMGIPNIGELGDKIPDSFYIDTEYKLDRSKYIHDMTIEEQDIVRYLGISDKLLAEDSNKKYLKYIGSKRMNSYDLRKAENFQVLYIPSAIPQEILTRLKDKLEKNRIYTINTLYSDAFRLDSDYFDNFIMILIVVQALLDIMAELPDFIIKMDIFDIRTVKLIFESNGIDYFPEIPFKYQLSMIKNLNTLKKYKSSKTGIVDICSLFGFENITVFKYYLFKDRRKDSSGDYANEWIKNDDGTYTEDLNANYELKFLKVPLNDNPDDYIHDNNAYKDYDEITLNDPYWDGYMDHEEVKRDIIQDEFNYDQSKYRSVESINSLTKSSFQMLYFYNMIFNDLNFADSLLMNLYCVDPLAKFRLTDVLCYIYALAYSSYGVKDKIMDTQTKILSVSGFNFKVNMQELSTYVHNKGFTLEELGASGYKIPQGQILTFNQLMEIFTNNTKIYDHIAEQLIYAPNKKIYDIYKYLYDSLFVHETTNKFFTMANGKVATSYTEFLSSRSSILYKSLLEIKAMEDPDSKAEKVTKMIGDSIYIIEQYLESDDFKYLFSNLPTQSAESIIKYVYKVLNFFKSFKVQIYDINIIYRFDDKLQNKINIIDQILFTYNYTKSDIIKVLDHIKGLNINFTKEDRYNIIDKLFLDISFDIDKYLNENITNKDEFKYLLCHLFKTDNFTINDFKEMIISLTKATAVSITDSKCINIYKTIEDKNMLEEKIFFEYVKEFDLYHKECITIKERLNRTSLLYKSNNINIQDNIILLNTYERD